MKILPLVLIAAGVSMMLRPKRVAAHTVSSSTVPLLSKSECGKRGGIWTGTDCLGAKSIAQLEAEATARLRRLEQQEAERTKYIEERAQFITDSIRDPGRTRESVRRTTTLL